MNRRDTLIILSMLALLPAAVCSQTGNTLLFDGNDDYIFIPDHSSLTMTAAITLEAWIATSSVNEEYILTKSEGAYYLGVNIDEHIGKVSIYLIGINDASGGWLFSTNTFNDGEWHHVAATYDGMSERLYVDGALEGTRTYAGTIAANTDAIGIGTRGGASHFNGYMDEVRIWNIARPQDSLIAAMNRRLSGSEAGLAACWPLDGTGSGAVAADLTPNNNSGSLSGFSFNAFDGWRTPAVLLPGSGTESDPYRVATYADLKGVGVLPNPLSGVYRLTADIDASTSASENGGAGFIPIGNEVSLFSGSFHGGGHTISNLHIIRPTENNIGLISYSSDTTRIDSLNIVNAVISGGNNVGSIAGGCNGTIAYSSATGSVTGVDYVGGIAGWGELIEYSFSTATVTGTNYQTGGVAGGCDTIRYSYNSGSVTGNTSVGGIAGYLAGTMSICFSSGSVTGTGDVGSLVGTTDLSKIDHSVWNRQSSPANGIGMDVGGTICTDTAGFSIVQMKAGINYIHLGWVPSLWNMRSGVNNGFPTLRWKDPSGRAITDSTLTFFAGTGTEADPYLVENYDGLHAVRYALSSVYRLTVNIDASASASENGGAGFLPIASGDTAFSGTFHGNGHTISSLHIDRPSSITGVGLFNFCDENALIDGLGLLNVSITGGEYTGSLAAESNGHIRNCYSTGAVSGGRNTGGLTGYARVLEYSYSTATVSGSIENTGGLTGVGDTVRYCYYKGTLSGNSDVGGLVGSAVTILNSYAAATVSGNSHVGGLAGRIEGPVKFCYALSSVTGSSDLGALAGLAYSGVIDSCVWNNEITSANVIGNNFGGIPFVNTSGLTTLQMKTGSSYTGRGWSSSVWNMESSANNGYPYHRWQNPSGQPLNAGTISIMAGAGTESFPYLISSFSTLKYLSEHSELWDKYFIQTVDIDASSTSTTAFSPIGNGSIAFSGSYNGQGHTISGMTINQPSWSNVGLFGYLSGGRVNNLRLTSVAISGNTDVGGIAGVNAGSINGCSVSGAINGYMQTGGITGSNSGSIRNVSVAGTVHGTTYAGGIAGVNNNSIENSVNRSAVSISGTISFMGFSFPGDDAGGITAGNYGAITNCFSAGAVSGCATMGGCVAENGGSFHPTGTISNCYWDRTLFTGNNGLGTGLLTSDMVANISHEGVWGNLQTNHGTNNEWQFVLWNYPALKYNITYELRGGSLAGFSDTTYAYGTGKSSLPVPTKGSLPFIGWYFDPGFISDPVSSLNASSAGNVTLYAKWDEPLPVELSSFTAAAAGTTIVLKWRTATEVNNHGFEVERRAIDNGKLIMENWFTIGFVEGNGTTNAAKEYSFVEKGLSAGKYSFRLKQIDRDGEFSYSQEVEALISSMPAVFALEQNFPNPFNPATAIRYQLPVNSMVTLKVYDAVGREVAVLVNEAKEAGRYEIPFDASHLASGVYFYRMTAGTFSSVKKFVLMK